MPEKPLDPQQRQILEQAHAAGGSCSIEGLTMLAMLQAATIVLELKRRGLVESRIQFSKEIPGQPVVVPVQLTPRAHRLLTE